MSVIGTIILRFRILHPSSTVTRSQAMCAALMFQAGTLGSIVLLGQWIFPIPFAAISCGGVGLTLMVLCWIGFEDPAQRRHIRTPLLSMALSYTNVLVHEAIGVLYTNQKDYSLAQAAAACCLPLAKYIGRYTQMKLLHSHREGFANAIISFEVELFNVLYTSVFLQRTESLLMMVVLMGVDVAENLYFLSSLEKAAETLSHQDRFTREKARLLFRCEMVVLVELIEVVAPLVYAIYIVCIWHSPLKQFYRHFEDVSEPQFYGSLGNVILLAGLQGFCLGLFMWRLHYKHRVPVIAQLGFAIREYRWVIVPTLIIWFNIVISTPIEHMGNDYSFSFLFGGA